MMIILKHYYKVKMLKCMEIKFLLKKKTEQEKLMK